MGSWSSPFVWICIVYHTVPLSLYASVNLKKYLGSCMVNICDNHKQIEKKL